MTSLLAFAALAALGGAFYWFMGDFQEETTWARWAGRFMAYVAFGVSGLLLLAALLLALKSTA